MKKLIVAAAVAASLIAGSAQAQSQSAPKGADLADMQCMAVFAVMGDADQSVEAVAGMAVFYYLGRLEGRTAGVDWLRRFADWMYSVPEAELAAQLDSNMDRCSQELMAKAEQLTTIGTEMANYGN